MDYREVAKELGVHQLFSKYGYDLWLVTPGNSKRKFRPHIVRLDGWTFDPHEIIEAIADDPDWHISYNEAQLNKAKGKDNE